MTQDHITDPRRPRQLAWQFCYNRGSCIWPPQRVRNTNDRRPLTVSSASVGISLNHLTYSAKGSTIHTHLTTQQLAEDKYYVNRALEVCTHIGLVILLIVACFVILRPFLPLIA